MLNTEGKLKVKYNFTEGHMRPRVLKQATLTSFPWSLVVAPRTVNLQTLTKLLGQMCTSGSLLTRETKNRARFKLHPSPPPPLHIQR